MECVYHCCDLQTKWSWSLNRQEILLHCITKFVQLVTLFLNILNALIRDNVESTGHNATLLTTNQFGDLISCVEAEMARYFVIIFLTRRRCLCLSRETNSINTLWKNESIIWSSCFYQPIRAATTRLRPHQNFPPAGRCGGDLICLLISLLAPINGHPFRTSMADPGTASGSDRAALLKLWVLRQAH